MRLRLPKTKELEGKTFDTVIIGGGPAGFSAAIYTSRFLMSSLVIAENVGGQLTLTDKVDDYPGTLEVPAADLVRNFKKHAEMFGTRVHWGDRVETFKRLEDGRYEILTRRGLKLYGRTVIVAIGSKRRKLGVPGEREFAGRGVSYCSVCDAPFFAGKEAVVVVGGGDAAFEGALMLSGYVKKVYLVHRRKQFRAKPFYVEKVLTLPNVEILVDTVVEEIRGEKTVNEVVVKNKITGEKKALKVDGVFIEIGFEPDIEWARKNGLNTDERGYIVVDEWMRTNLPGVFAAGDCTTMWLGFRQVVTAAAMGAVAAYSAFNYLAEHGG
ncbi:MAG: thioredoxin-disulfide reductase [Desulfurococcales archaeon]|nr:thioredoxin-disulfide reductase [Desulfurococcales archaeon]